MLTANHTVCRSRQGAPGGYPHLRPSSPVARPPACQCGLHWASKTLPPHPTPTPTHPTHPRRPACLPHLQVKTLTGKEIEIDIEPTDTVQRIKERVEEKEGIPPVQQR